MIQLLGFSSTSWIYNYNLWNELIAKGIETALWAWLPDFESGDKSSGANRRSELVRSVRIGSGLVKEGST